MDLIIYLIRCVIVLLFTWLCVRIIGKKSISQMTSYDLAGTFVLANVAAEPLVYKVVTKAFVGSLAIALGVTFIGWISLNRLFYNLDSKPDIVIYNGKINQKALNKNKANLPFLLSLLRMQGFANVSDIEIAIFEPNGNLSVLPKSQNRPLTPQDMKIETQYEGLALPLIIDGRIQYDNLKYAKLDMNWLNHELHKNGKNHPEKILLAELNSSGNLYLYEKENIEDEFPNLI